jgi:Ca2+-binding RTX toxin-like protein
MHLRVATAVPATITLPAERATNVLSGGMDNDTLVGGVGNDGLSGGGGADTASYAGETAVYIDLAAGTARRGSSEQQSKIRRHRSKTSPVAPTLTPFIGSSCANLLDYGAGDDTLVDGSDADTPLGGAGNDSLNGGCR